MKVAVLAMTERGTDKLTSFVSDKSGPVLEMAKKVRASGKFEGKDIANGIVIASWQPMPMMQFIVPATIAKAKKADKK